MKTLFLSVSSMLLLIGFMAGTFAHDPIFGAGALISSAGFAIAAAVCASRKI